MIVTVLYWVIAFLVFCWMQMYLAFERTYFGNLIGDSIVAIIAAVFWPATLPFILLSTYRLKKR